MKTPEQQEEKGKVLRSLRTEPKIKIQNVVASASFKHGVDLKAVARAFPNAKYRPETFPGLVFRLNKPKTTTLIFSTGKMVCTGAHGEKEAERAIRKVTRELKNAGIIIHGKPEINIQNIVASVDLGDVMVDIERGIYKLDELGIRIMYEPEQFPGAILRMEDPHVVFLIFYSGKLVCVGAKREIDVYRAVEKLAAVLDENGLITRTEVTEG